MTAQPEPAFEGWLDAFFASYFRRRPVNATFVGMHAFDDRLPDLSEAGMAASLGDAEDLLRRLDAVAPDGLNSTQALDRQVARGFLRIQRWELTSTHFGPANPTLWTGEAIFGLVSLLLRPFAPLEQRLELATARLAGVPSLLDQAMRHVRHAPSAWIARARRECLGARLLLDNPAFQRLASGDGQSGALNGAARVAVEAFGRFDRFLEDQLAAASSAYACGGEAFDLLLREAHFFEAGADELERLALACIAREEAARDAQAPPPPAVVAHDDPRPYLARFEAVWNAARRLAVERDLLTFPAWPVRYVERPAWARDAAAYLYFLPYRSPPPLERVASVDYLVPPGADDSTIKLNHVVHHGSLGHHVQNWFAARAESRLGRIAAVDCAARIALLSGGTMAEGWATYATDLADEAGFLTPAERYAQHTAHIRMAARAVVDIRLHHGRLTLGEAAAFYRDRAGMTPAAAEAEAIKNSLFPGAACMYFAGWDAIWALRRALEQRQAGDFSLHAFHDRLLAFGSLPVALIARTMLESPAAALAAPG